MKAKLLILFSLLALLLVSTAVLADGRPSGIRIGRVASGGGTNVEIDVTVDTTFVWTPQSYSTILIGNGWANSNGSVFYHYESSNFNVPLPWAVDWGDGYYFRTLPLFGPPGGPFRGTFAHTYLTPGSYTITVGDALSAAGSTLCCVNSGNVISVTAAYWGFENTTGSFDTTPTITWPGESRAVALTANATVTTGTDIPALNRYGVLALALVLVGTGVLLYRKPQQARRFP